MPIPIMAIGGRKTGLDLDGQWPLADANLPIGPFMKRAAAARNETTVRRLLHVALFMRAVVIRSKWLIQSAGGCVERSIIN